jgi:hypothetical protein
MLFFIFAFGQWRKCLHSSFFVKIFKVDVIKVYKILLKVESFAHKNDEKSTCALDGV